MINRGLSLRYPLLEICGMTPIAFDVNLLI